MMFFTIHAKCFRNMDCDQINNEKQIARISERLAACKRLNCNYRVATATMELAEKIRAAYEGIVPVVIERAHQEYRYKPKHLHKKGGPPKGVAAPVHPGRALFEFAVSTCAGDRLVVIAPSEARMRAMVREWADGQPVVCSPIYTHRNFRRCIVNKSIFRREAAAGAASGVRLLSAVQSVHPISLIPPQSPHLDRDGRFGRPSAVPTHSRLAQRPTAAGDPTRQEMQS